MIVIAYKSTAPERERQPHFWIDTREEAALAVHVYERLDDEPATGNGQRADAAPELTTCYDASHD